MFTFPGIKHSSLAEISDILSSIQNVNSSQSEARKHLAENCRKTGLQFHGSIPEDGNCFFHAVSDQLSLLRLKHQDAEELRYQVVSYLTSHPRIQVRMRSKM